MSLKSEGGGGGGGQCPGALAYVLALKELVIFHMHFYILSEG